MKKTIIFLTALLFGLWAIKSFAEDALTLPTINYANDCSFEIPGPYIEEELEADKKNYFILDTASYVRNFSDKLSVNLLFQLTTVQNILQLNSKNGLTLKEEDTGCLLKFYFNSIPLAQKNKDVFKTIVNAYYSSGTPSYKEIIFKSLIAELDKKFKVADDFSLLDALNIELAKSLFAQSSALQLAYQQISLEDKIKAYEKDSLPKKFFCELLGSDKEFLNLRKIQKINTELNNKLPPGDSDYRTWDEVTSSIENNNLDIPKITTIMDHFSVLSLLETIEWPTEKKCLFFQKLIKPFRLYSYSSAKNQYVEQLYNTKLSCAKSLLAAEKIYPTDDERYFSRWCKEEKDQAKCKMYFTSTWLKSITACTSDQQCTKTALSNNQSFFYNGKNKNKTEQITFFTERARYFQESLEQIAFPITSLPVCKNNACKPDLKFCEPTILFESFLLQLKGQKYNECKMESDCVLKEFRPKSLDGVYYYAISKEFINYSNQNLVHIYDEAIEDCQRDLGKGYIKSTKIKLKYAPDNMSTACIKNRCEIKFSF